MRIIGLNCMVKAEQQLVWLKHCAKKIPISGPSLLAIIRYIPLLAAETTSAETPPGIVPGRYGVAGARPCVHPCHDAPQKITGKKQCSIVYMVSGINELGGFYVNATVEGHLTWTVTTTVPAGKVFAMDCADGSNFADLNGAVSGTGGLSDYGTVSGHLGGAVALFPPSGDQIIIYQGTSGTTTGATFIYGYSTTQNATSISGTGVWQTSGTVASQVGSYLPTGLSNGTTAIALTHNVNNTSSGPGTFGTPNYGFDNMIYAGIRTGARAQLLAAIGTPANHIGDNATPYPIGIGGSFSIPSDFTITGTLPLHWGEIAGKLKNGKALIQWETIQEMNTSHFDLEISTDGQQYVAQRSGIAAAGNSDNKRSYQYEFSTNVSLIYARVKQVDIDGAYTYSKVIVLKNDQTGTLRLLNNPVVNEQLVFTAPDGLKEAKYSIFSASGLLLKSGKLEAGNGGNKMVTLGNIPAGTYQLVIFDQTPKISRQFIKL
ncbi:T9SS type A sorting domain-containing protein [Parasegetibacter sp. NRK P23]|uniref:T9SS type A sorting domain-containing protein n=1 Tax=Parasegetibacter sp. NRK P23 TaxID=2942999 RepID=UPI0020448655|nr:T9SS type A sorting domain-containing protein [Parasegetibacter sp. NRK P23]MCM5529289.1 T9SS type A sorting domain-containing protein [Parasegetibacter sp. NRK P23]